MSLSNNFIRQIDIGLTPAEVIRKETQFPKMFRDLYSTGEASGQLDDSLQRLAKYYQDEGLRHLITASTVATAVVYGIAAISVAFIVISFWLNYYGSILNTN